MVSHFKVQARIDGARDACVEIDRGRQLITVRPFRRRTSYTMPLGQAAEILVWHVLRLDFPVTRPQPRRRAS